MLLAAQSTKKVLLLQPPDKVRILDRNTDAYTGLQNGLRLVNGKMEMYSFQEE